MNQEWYCTGKVIAQITICICHFNLRRAQDTNLEFHQRGSDATVVHNNMPASALDKVVTFAVEVLCERKSPTSIETEATPGERIDLRKSGQSEIPHAQDVKAENTFLISS